MIVRLLVDLDTSTHDDTQTIVSLMELIQDHARVQVVGIDHAFHHYGTLMGAQEVHR